MEKLKKKREVKANMFWFFGIVSFILIAWIVYELFMQERREGAHKVLIEIDGDIDRFEFILKHLAKDRDIKIKSMKILKDEESKKKEQLIEIIKKLKRKIKKRT